MNLQSIDDKTAATLLELVKSSQWDVFMDFFDAVRAQYESDCAYNVGQPIDFLRGRIAGLADLKRHLKRVVISPVDIKHEGEPPEVHRWPSGPTGYDS